MEFPGNPEVIHDWIPSERKELLKDFESNSLRNYRGTPEVIPEVTPKGIPG